MTVQIAYALHQLEAGQMHALLESEGFHPAAIDYAANVSLAGAEFGYEIRVSPDEVEAAKELLVGYGFEARMV